MNLTKKRKKKGFTLIELMAVVAIIAILAAVLVPTVTGYINRSKKTAIISQVRTVITAVETHNATATGTGIISTSKTVADLVGKKADGTATTSDALIESDLLTAESVNRLSDMTVGLAQLINEDQNAIKTIEVNKDGSFKSYTVKGSTEDQDKTWLPEQDPNATQQQQQGDE